MTKEQNQGEKIIAIHELTREEQQKIIDQKNQEIRKLTSERDQLKLELDSKTKSLDDAREIHWENLEKKAII
jgi:hypothetical protein